MRLFKDEPVWTALNRKCTYQLLSREPALTYTD